MVMLVCRVCRGWVVVVGWCCWSYQDLLRNTVLPPDQETMEAIQTDMMDELSTRAAKRRSHADAVRVCFKLSKGGGWGLTDQTRAEKGGWGRLQWAY